MPEAQLVHEVFAAIVRDVGLAERLRAEPHATLASLGLDEPTRTRVLEAGVERLFAYNAMVHSRLLRTVEEFSPRATSLVAAQLPGLVHAWIADRGPTSPYLRDVPSEFLEWARPRWATLIAAGEAPPWLIELFEHELVQRALVRDMQGCGQPSPHTVQIDRGMLGNATARVIRREFAVHRLPNKLDPAALPTLERGSVALVAWRDAHDRPRFLELRARHAALLEQLLAGASLGEALRTACASLGETLDDVILGDAAVTLAQWCDDQVLLGASD